MDEEREIGRARVSGKFQISLILPVRTLLAKEGIKPGDRVVFKAKAVNGKVVVLVEKVKA